MSASNASNWCQSTHFQYGPRCLSVDESESDSVARAHGEDDEDEAGVQGEGGQRVAGTVYSGIGNNYIMTNK